MERKTVVNVWIVKTFKHLCKQKQQCSNKSSHLSITIFYWINEKTTKLTKHRIGWTILWMKLMWVILKDKYEKEKGWIDWSINEFQLFFSW